MVANESSANYTDVYHTDEDAEQANLFIILEVPAILFVTVSNIMVLLLLKKMTKVQNSYFVVSLSVANLTVGLLGLPLAMFAHWSAFSGEAFCKTYHYFVQVSQCAEVYSLVAIAIDRHRVVVGHRANSNTTNKMASIAAVSAIWLFSVLYGLTSVFTHEETSRIILVGWVWHHYHDCYFLLNSITVRCILILNCLLLFILPLSLMSFYYFSIVQFVHREQNNTMSYAANHKNRLIRTILLLMGIFVVFNLPLQTFDLYVHFNAINFEKENLIREILEYIAFLNYGVNAFTYALLSANFKMACNKCGGCCLKLQIQSEISLVNVRGENGISARSLATVSTNLIVVSKFTPEINTSSTVKGDHK